MANICTDLLVEAIGAYNKESANEADAFATKKFKRNYGIKLETFNVDSEHVAQLIERPQGAYCLFEKRDLIDLNSAGMRYYANSISDQLKAMIPHFESVSSVLVVGLGNKYILADSLGDFVLKNVLVTRHISEECVKLPKISAFLPSVVSLTGIESVELIKMVTKLVNPDVVVIIDSLSANDVARLGVSIQLTNSGLLPGGGVNNPRVYIDKETLGCECVVIGVPLMVYAKTYVTNTLENNNIFIEEIDGIVEQFIDKKTKFDVDKSFVSIMKNLQTVFARDHGNEVVTLSDVKLLIEKSAKIIAMAINKCFLDIYSMN